MTGLTIARAVCPGQRLGLPFPIATILATKSLLKIMLYFYMLLYPSELSFPPAWHLKILRYDNSFCRAQLSCLRKAQTTPITQRQIIMLLDYSAPGLFFSFSFINSFFQLLQTSIHPTNIYGESTKQPVLQKLGQNILGLFSSSERGRDSVYHSEAFRKSASI